MRTCLILLFLIGMLPCRAQKANRILMKHFKAMKYHKMKVFEECVTDWEGANFTLTLFQGRGRFKQEGKSNGKRFAYAYDGNVGVKYDEFQGDTQPQLLEGAELTKLLSNAQSELEGELYTFYKQGGAIHFQGVEEFERQQHYIFTIDASPWGKRMYYIDSESFLLRKKVIFTDKENITLLFDDYHKLARNIPVAHLVGRLPSQGRISIRQLKHLNFGPTIDLNHYREVTN